MKKLVFVLTILLSSYFGFSQKLTGLWNGTFSNDSTTLRSDQPFEIALTEYKGKVYGYSRREFIKNDTLYFVLKRVKGEINGDICEVTEDEYISNNFPGKPDKGVKITYTFHFNKNDSSWSLDGRWRTNRVVKRKYEYYSLSGKVEMITQKDLSKSKLFPHLAELNLDEDVPFYAAYKKQVAIEEEQKNIAAAKVLADQKKIELAKAEAKKKEEAAVAKANTNVPPKQEAVKTNTDQEKKKTEVASVKPETAAKSKEKEQQQQTAVENVSKDAVKTNAEPEKKKEEIAKKDDDIKTPVVVSKPKADPNLPTIPTAAANVEKRRTESIQTINFKSDSITLALYDNGEIDGDTVSVLVNGEVVMPQQGLKATAIRKTIYITPAMQDSFKLVLYAENLGKYPPNTGLIIVRDGEDSYQVRFSADLQKNVEVIFRRKKQ